MAWIRACGGGSPAIPNGKTVTPTDDVTIWQKCAGIANPTYTTLAAILADSSVLAALISSNNAADYMARSTSFASTVCANSSAMTYIGADNYCADVLLTDSTWRTAICNSTYYTSVLNVTNPVMTSNTSPSGVASADSLRSGCQAYNAFDSNGNTVWEPTLNKANSWIKYQFANNVKIALCKVSTLTGLDSGYTMYSTTSNFTSSLDDSNYESVGSVVVASKSYSGGGDTNIPQSFNVIFNSYVESKYIKLTTPLAMYPDDHRNVGFATLRYYGRSAV